MIFDLISVCYSYCNKQYHDLDDILLVNAAINKYFKDKPNEPVVVLYHQDAKDLYRYLQRNFSKDRRIVYLPGDEYSDSHVEYNKHLQNVKEYLKNPEGILVTGINNFHGAQARNLIILDPSTTLEEYRNEDIVIRDMIMRTMSFAIIIHIKELEKTVPGLVTDINLDEYIHQSNTESEFYHYNNVYGINEDILAKAIKNRYIDCQFLKENLLIITNDCGEKISQVLKHNYLSQ